MRKPVNVSMDAEESLLGKVGRVTVSIPAHGPGEVLLPIRGASEAFAAWSDEPIPRHTRRNSALSPVTAASSCR